MLRYFQFRVVFVARMISAFGRNQFCLDLICNKETIYISFCLKKMKVNVAKGANSIYTCFAIFSVRFLRNDFCVKTIIKATTITFAPFFMTEQNENNNTLC